MNIKKGTVSVILPVYNREKYIEECICSVVEQSYENFEIILVDDGSTDNTLSICKRIIEKDSRIKLFEGEHKGVSAARNMALDKAEGEYVFFLDSDDTIHPLLFEGLVKGFSNEKIAISATSCFSIRHTNWHKLEKAKEKYPAPAELEFLDNSQAVNAMFSGNTPINLIGGCMMRRDYVDTTRFNKDIYIGEDFLFIYENLIKGGGVVFLKQKWYYQRIHDDNSSWDWRFEGFLTRFNRRLLVAESEKRLGRQRYAKIQVADAFYVFCTCQHRNKLFGSEARKIRKHVKQYKNMFFEFFDAKGKIHYYLAVYVPWLYYSITNAYAKLRKK